MQVSDSFQIMKRDVKLFLWEMSFPSNSRHDYPCPSILSEHLDSFEFKKFVIVPHFEWCEEAWFTTEAVGPLRKVLCKSSLRGGHPESVSHMCHASYIVHCFTVHDLRRSAATAWAEHLKIQPHIIERMLNHQPLNKLVATYQRAQYVEEQEKAWEAWGELVYTAIANNAGNVIPFRGFK